jgi:hypothetical protein
MLCVRGIPTLDALFEEANRLNLRPVTHLRRSTVLGTSWSEFVQVLRQLADRVDALAAAAAPEYYADRSVEVAAVIAQETFNSTPESLKDPDSFVHRRFAMQSALITHMKQSGALAISTVRDDMDRLLAVPYFAIDHRLLSAVTVTESK